jgi:hypothetical protein
LFTESAFRDIVIAQADIHAPMQPSSECTFELITIDIDDFVFNALCCA